jgi:hypothetical protein
MAVIQFPRRPDIPIAHAPSRPRPAATRRDRIVAVLAFIRDSDCSMTTIRAALKSASTSSRAVR